jgi:dihydrofolate reductase / thymidylate synthase
MSNNTETETEINVKHFNYSIIVAYSYPEYGIGLSGQIPWYIASDLRHFREMTIGKVVIMGRKTWDALPLKYKPLPNRHNIIITRTPDKDEYQGIVSKYNLSNNKVNFTTYENLNELINTKCVNNDEIVFIGGGEIYRKALEDYLITSLYITEIYKNVKKNMNDFDVFFPNTRQLRELMSNNNNSNPLRYYNVKEIIKDEKSGLYYRFYTLINTNANINDNINDDKYISNEDQYLEIMKRIVDNGIERDDRTGTGTISLFGTQQRYDLSSGEFPISTTKRIFFRAIFEELSLYLSGKTDNKILQEKGIHIWDGNTSREFLDKRGLIDYPEGDMGETYGFNFRHFGGIYKDCKTEYPPGINGFDQVANLLNLLRNDPTSRRMIINLWNPATLNRATLPSCLMMYQFYVDTHAKKLNCQIYLRSSDYFLANNWNTCTGALLIHMICNLKDIDLTPGELIVITGDTHIYKTHLEQVQLNLKRCCYPAPKLIFTNGEHDKLTDYKFEDLRLIGYRCGPSIKADMAV